MRVYELTAGLPLEVDIKAGEYFTILAWLCTMVIPKDILEIKINVRDPEHSYFKQYPKHIFNDKYGRPETGWFEDDTLPVWAKAEHNIKTITITTRDVNDIKFILGVHHEDDDEARRGHLEYDVDKKLGKDEITFCTQWIKTVGDDKTIGARCPIDVQSKSEMKDCLNWRRDDAVGLKCRLVLSQQQMVDSSTVFCRANPNSEDCKCINRLSDSEYTKDKSAHSEHDYCWYSPCSSGHYLKNAITDEFTCNSKKCKVVYDFKNKLDVSMTNVGTKIQCEDNPSSLNLDVVTEKKESLGEDDDNQTIIRHPKNTDWVNRTTQESPFDFFMQNQIYILGIGVLLLVAVIGSFFMIRK